MSLSLVTPPGAATDVLSLASMRQQTKTEGITADDALVTGTIIPAAVDRCELKTERQLPDATWELRLDGWPRCGWIEIPKPPLVSITSVKYYDTNGVQQTWASTNYDVDIPVGPRCRRGRLALAYGVSWPTVQCRVNAITIRFRAGYVNESGSGGPTRSIPTLLVEAMLLDAGALYRQREQVVTGTIVAELPNGSQEIYRSFRSRATQRL
jgi:uncharacterized phiE125 gp8 family phage protein